MFSLFQKFTQKSFNFNKIAFKNYRQRLGFKEKLSSPALGYAFLGIGVGGLGLLMYNAGSRRADYTRAMIASGQTVDKNLSLERTRQTLMYFTGGLGLTSVLTAAMLRNQTILRWSTSMGPLLATIPVTIFCMYKMWTTPITSNNSFEKHLYWLGFNSAIAFSLVPIIYGAELMVIRDAFLLTGGSMAGLGLVAYNSRDDAFIGMSGFLGASMGGLAAIGIANLFLQSNALGNIWLYGGLALFLAYVLYDVKEIQNRAKYAVNFDPMAQSISVYLDFINIFIRILMIMQNRKK